jgi:tubulin polyglutamylase TTLL2
MRIYVVITSMKPLKIYLYKEGLIRFSTEKYDMKDLGNKFIHLTNTSINKYSPSINA